MDLKPLREAAIAVPSPQITEKRKAEETDANKDLKKVHLIYKKKKIILSLIFISVWHGVLILFPPHSRLT